MRGFLFLADSANIDEQDGTFNVLKGGMIWSRHPILPSKLFGAVVICMAAGPDEGGEHEVEVRVTGPDNQTRTLAEAAGKWKCAACEQLNAVRRIILEIPSAGLYFLALVVDGQVLNTWSHLAVEPEKAKEAPAR